VIMDNMGQQTTNPLRNQDGSQSHFQGRFR
jgi:hypothetical protein